MYGTYLHRILCFDTQNLVGAEERAERTDRLAEMYYMACPKSPLGTCLSLCPFSNLLDDENNPFNCDKGENYNM